jgi:hypothetical protein
MSSYCCENSNNNSFYNKQNILLVSNNNLLKSSNLLNNSSSIINRAKDYNYFKNLTKTKKLFDHNKLLLRRKIELKWKKDYLHINNQSSSKLLEYRIMVSLLMNPNLKN